MKFNNHYHLKGEHAFLGASKYHWVNYSEEKLVSTYRNYHAARRGTELHELAEILIAKRVKLPATSNALNAFVNDSISEGMDPEVILYYSDAAFGTADAISFKDDLLRIYDLKTGKSKPSMRQLEIYAALFCLEYNIDPNSIDMILRIYQGESFMEHIPTGVVIQDIMDKTIAFDELIDHLNSGLE